MSQNITYDFDTATQQQLEELNKQNIGPAKWAHLASYALLIVFSGISLVTISQVALNKFILGVTHGQFDVVDLVSVTLNFLLVLGMDMAMISAAEKLRALESAHASTRQKIIHQAIIVLVCVTEGTTYLYHVWQTEHPSGFVLWSIVVLRAFGAPMVATYLSLVRPSPVTPGDIAYHVSLASGRGLIVDAAKHASDPKKPMEEKAKMYRASAYMTDAQKEQFNEIVEATNGVLASPTPLTPPISPNMPPPVSSASRSTRSGPTIYWDDVPSGNGPHIYRAMPEPMVVEGGDE